jgi:hypothetical protein
MLARCEVGVFTAMPYGACWFAGVRANPVTATRTELDSGNPPAGCFTADEKHRLLAAAIAAQPCSPRYIFSLLSKPSMLSRNHAPRQIPHRESRRLTPASNSVRKSE